MRAPLFLASLSSCLFMCAGCGGPADLGGSCDPANEGSCAEGLVCAPDESDANVCQIPIGAECDAAREPTGCVYGSECIEVTEVVDGEETMVDRCYVTEGGACDPTMDQCAPSLTCAELTDGTYACHRPLLFRGRVLDSTDSSPIEGAHVLGLDAQPVAVTDIAVSEADGSYELEVPVVRNEDGSPVAASYTLRGGADGYQTFPSGIRTAIPINTTLAAELDEGWVVMGTLTDVALIPVEDPSAPRASITGTVRAQADSGGVLVVAATTGGPGYTAISGRGGDYTIFNVPPGEYEVRGYGQGLSLAPEAVTVADADLAGVDLGLSEAALSQVTGTTQIVNGGDCEATSFILVVESTFVEAIGRGEVPRGLRAPEPGAPPSIRNSETWTIPDVPEGRYVVLAAFENDFCVRDPDTSIAGTLPVHLALPADAGTIGESFKITGALAVMSPGVDEPEAVTEPPTLTWEDDSGEQDYLVEVFDAYGDLVWMEVVPGVSGSASASVEYGGPFEAGMYYQFRATSRSGSMVPLSRTEDLRGVFYRP